VCIHDTLSVVKARLGGELAVKRKLEAEERLGLTCSILTKFHLVILTPSKKEFMTNMRSLLQNLIDNQLDRLLAYFVTFWLLRKDFPPATWALAYRSNAADGAAFKNMSRHNVLVSSCVYPREHLAYNKSGGVSALFRHLHKTAVHFDQRVEMFKPVTAKKRKQQQTSDNATAIVKASSAGLLTSTHVHALAAQAPSMAAVSASAAATPSAGAIPSSRPVRPMNAPSTTASATTGGAMPTEGRQHGMFMDTSLDTTENMDVDIYEPTLQGDAMSLAVVGQHIAMGLMKIERINDDKAFMQDVVREARKHVVSRVRALRQGNRCTGNNAGDSHAVDAGETSNNTSDIRSNAQARQSPPTTSSAPEVGTAPPPVIPTLGDECAGRAARRRARGDAELAVRSSAQVAAGMLSSNPSSSASNAHVTSKTYTLLDLPGSLVQRMLEPNGVVACEASDEVKSELAVLGYHPVPKGALLGKASVSVSEVMISPNRDALDQFIADRPAVGLRVVFEYTNPYAGDGLGDGWNRPSGQLFAI
jgi:hypothetical protein